MDCKQLTTEILGSLKNLSILDCSPPHRHHHSSEARHDEKLVRSEGSIPIAATPHSTGSYSTEMRKRRKHIAIRHSPYSLKAPHVKARKSLSF